jgi:hypothetical protein
VEAIPGPLRASDKVASAKTLQWLNGKAIDRGFKAILPDEVFHHIDWEGEHRCDWVQESGGPGVPHVLTAWKVRLDRPASIDRPQVQDRLLDPSLAPEEAVVHTVELELSIEQSDYEALRSSAASRPA